MSLFSNYNHSLNDSSHERYAQKYILMEQCLIHVNSKVGHEQLQSEQAWYDSEESFCLPRPSYHYTLGKMSQ